MPPDNAWNCGGPANAPHVLRSFAPGEACALCGATSPEQTLREASDELARLRAELAAAKRAA